MLINSTCPVQDIYSWNAFYDPCGLSKGLRIRQLTVKLFHNIRFTVTVLLSRASKFPTAVGRFRTWPLDSMTWKAISSEQDTFPTLSDLLSIIKYTNLAGFIIHMHTKKLCHSLSSLQEEQPILWLHCGSSGQPNRRREIQP